MPSMSPRKSHSEALPHLPGFRNPCGALAALVVPLGPSANFTTLGLDSSMLCSKTPTRWCFGCFAWWYFPIFKRHECADYFVINNKYSSSFVYSGKHHAFQFRTCGIASSQQLPRSTLTSKPSLFACGRSPRLRRAVKVSIPARGQSLFPLHRGDRVPALLPEAMAELLGLAA